VPNTTDKSAATTATTPATTQEVLIARAILRDIRHTPQKARRIVDLIRGQRADEALSILKFAPQAAGQDVYTLLASAVANAKQKKSAIRDASQGRGFRILKRSSHISVAVSDSKKGATK